MSLKKDLEKLIINIKDKTMKINQVDSRNAFLEIPQYPDYSRNVRIR